MLNLETELFGFRGRTAMIWGGGGGIGATTSRLLAALGANVAIVDMDQAAAERLATELRAAGQEALAIGCDVRNEASVDEAVDRTVEKLGLPVRSASIVGIAGWSNLISMSTDMWDEQLALNLRPMFLIGRKIARVLRDGGQGGTLAFVGSIAGRQAAARHAAYGAAKAGMAALAQSMAAEWGTLGIRVNCIAPGPIATARVPLSPEMEALFARKLPTGRFGTMDEIARALIFLLSDMAGYVNGETLLADGGWMATAPISPDDNPLLPSGD